MFIIDFRSSEYSIKASIKNRNSLSWAAPVFDFIDSWLDGADSFEVKTSGSTGAPKVISHSRAAVIASATRTCDFFGLKESDTALLALPATHIGGKMMIARSIIRKLQLICIEPKSDPLSALDFDERIDFASFTPMQMSMILSNALSADKLSHFSQIILGGGEVSSTLREQLQSISPEVYETYGMTETISHIALKKINGPDRSECFTTLDGVSIAQDERGCLVITAPHLSPTDIVTNDLVNIISEKQFQWLGRYDNIINTGGIKVSAEEIERKLQPHIRESFFVIGTANDILGQQVTLVIESHKDVSQQYIDAIQASLSRYERPKRVVAINKFTYTANGKIDKRATLRFDNF